MKSDLRIINAGDPLHDHLEQFKMYASVPDNSRDGILLKILKRAMLTVQEHADKALLPCTIELTVYDVAGGDAIPLYQGGRTVTSVTDREGNDVDYTLDAGRIIVHQSATSVTVTYENAVTCADAEKLQPVCWELATAIYDGEEASKQASIIKKIYYAL
ncbi:MAG: hypothetical protein II008_12250 [Oscillospiraceae bacterium]|nr:hypothetical protein [Oscillospiraceae bacterium]